MFLLSCLSLWAGGVSRAENEATGEAAKENKTDDAAAKSSATKEDKSGDKSDDSTSGGTPSNPGQGDLDKATQLKVTAEGLPDLNEVVDKLDSAIEKGLDKDNKAFAEQLLTSTLLQRATMLSSAILDRQAQDPRRDLRWLQIRQYALTDLQRAVALDDKLWDAQLLIGRLQALPLGDPNAARRALSKVCDAEDAAPEQRAESCALRGVLQTDEKKR